MRIQNSTQPPALWIFVKKRIELGIFAVACGVLLTENILGLVVYCKSRPYHEFP